MITALEIQHNVQLAIAPHKTDYKYLTALAWEVGRATIPAKRITRLQKKALENAVTAALENHSYLN